MPQRIFLLGVFLTPFTRILVIPGVGVSLGDVVLLLGGLLLLLKSSTSDGNGSRLWVPAIAGPGIAIVVATLVSALVNQSASLQATAALASQYAVTMLFLPWVLSRQPFELVVRVAKAFVIGLAVSVALGMLIITYFPALEIQLIARGYMFAVGGERNGLFSGIGELSKMAGMSIPLVYFLTLRGRIALRTAGLVFGALIVALIVTRSGSGFVAAVATLAVLGFAHIALRPQFRGQAAQGITMKAAALLLVGVGVGVLAINQLDSAGGDYAAAFSQRVASPLASEGIDGVGSAQVRFRLMDESWRVIGEHPLAGIGPGLYLDESVYRQGVHVVPLMLWAETGLLAAAGWLWMVCVAAAGIFAAARRAPIAAVAALGVMTALVATALTAPYMYGRGLFLPFLLAVFLLGDRQGSDEAAVGEVERGELAPTGRGRPTRR